MALSDVGRSSAFPHDRGCGRRRCRFKRELRGHEARTVQDLGWAGIKSGALLRLANGQFDVLLTVDQGIEYQQNLSDLSISVVIMMAPSNDVDDLRPLLSAADR